MLLRTPASAAVESRLFVPGQTLHAPHLLDIEVAQVIRKFGARGEIDAERGRVALDDLGAVRMQRYPHDFLQRWTPCCSPVTTVWQGPSAIVPAWSWCEGVSTS